MNEDKIIEMLIQYNNLPKCCDRVKYRDCKALVHGDFCNGLNSTIFKNNECRFYSELDNNHISTHDIYGEIDTIEFMEWLLKQPFKNKACAYLKDGKTKVDITSLCLRKVIRELQELRRFKNGI